MNLEDTFSFIPQELQSLPWIQRLIALLQEQAEEIAALKKTVQEQRDEINRLKNMPKRPKFRPGGGDPKSRSGKPVGNKERLGLNNDIASKKIRQEITILASNIPEGSRFKGYQEYSIQEFELISKDIIYRLEVGKRLMEQ
jgi:hypothetical protein